MSRTLTGVSAIKPFKNVLVLGDVHAPYHDEKAVNKAIDEGAPGADLVVQVGDLADQFVFSRYARDPDMPGPSKEMDAARAAAERLWTRVKKRAPRAKCFQLLGNHDARTHKRIAENAPETIYFAKKGIHDFYTFKGVETIYDPAEELIVPVKGAYGVQDHVFMHGYRSRLGDHATYNNLPTIVGHSHVGGVVCFRRRDSVIFELNAGFLGDINAPVFRYGQQVRIKRWTVGFGRIDHFGPKFCLISGGENHVDSYVNR